MTRQERIHALQNNDLVYSRLAEESQVLLKEVGKENLVCWQETRWSKSSSLDPFGWGIVYRINNDYKEAGTVSYPVVIEVGQLCYKRFGLTYNLIDALNMSGFSHYKYENGTESANTTRFTDIGKSARYPKYVVFANE